MSEIRVDTISEKTSANGVAVDGVTLKDGGIAATAGSTITVTDNSDALTLKSTSANSVTGPVLLFNRDSASPANDDFLGTIDFQGDNSAGDTHDYIRIISRILNVTDGSEQADLVIKDATGNNIVNMAHTEVVYNDDSVDRDFRVESNGNANMLFVDGGNDCVNIGASSDRGGLLNVEGNGGVVIRVADNNDALKLQSTDTDANAGPLLTLERTNNSAADSDDIGKIILKAQNDANQAVEYGIIRGDITDASDGTEDGVIKVETLVAGTNREIARFGDGVGVVFNEDSQAISFRVESDSSTKAFFVNNNYAVAHISATGSATKESYYSGGMAMLQLGIGGGIYGYDYNVVDGPYIVNNIYIDNGTSKYVGTGQAAQLGMYQGMLQFWNTGSGSADGAISLSERFRIANNGDITATDTSIGSNSDERLKENIADFTYDVAKFKQFKPKTFDWKNPEIHSGVSGNRGFIAQEIETIDDYYINKEELTLPETQETGNADYNLIPEDEDGKRISYTSKLGKKDAMYISVIQQLITRIEALEG